MGKAKDLSGQHFGRLTVIGIHSKASRKPHKQTTWSCICECGNSCIVRQGNLCSGNTKSCGCLKYENQGAYSPNSNRMYNSWRGMKNRCNNKSSNRYHLYGGRGIKVCVEWENSFDTFKKWALANGYADNLTLDRIDPNLGYCPENCRWIPPEKQSKNRRCCKK